MSHPNAIPKQQIELRREKVRMLMARGVRKPAQILANKSMKDEYSIYKDPYATCRHDMKKVNQDNENLVKSGLVDGALGSYISSLYELLQNCYKDYSKLEGSAKVGMANTIHTLLQDIARAYGIDPDKIDPRAMMLNIENTVDSSEKGIELPDEIYDEFATYLARKISEDNQGSSESTAE